MMTEKQVRNALIGYKKGTFIRIKYRKQLTNGYYAIVEINTRLGCRYGKVVKHKNVFISDYARPVDKDKIIYRHCNNGTLYIQHEPQVGRPESRKTTVYNQFGDVVNCKYNEKVDNSKIKRIKLENLISIGKKWCKDEWV